jgi:aminopeptidase N
MRSTKTIPALLALIFALIALPVHAQRPDRSGLAIQGYIIDAELDTASHHITAKTTVTFTANDTAEMVSFGLHPALKLNRITDDSGKVITGDRSADGTVRIAPNTPFVKGQQNRWTFEYDGVLTGAEDGPIEGLKLASINEPISYLFYAARWFPTTGYLTNRFTAEMHIRVPQGLRVLGSGADPKPQPAKLANGKPADQYNFNWTKPGFPGTIIAGRFIAPVSGGLAGNIKIYVTPAHQASAEKLATAASQEFEFFSTAFGQPESSHLNVVEIPDDTIPAYWAPELAAIQGSRVGDKSGIRLLANTIARQWWSSEISPASLNDAWITNGMCRYSELLYLEDQGGRSALNTALPDIEAGALAYDTIPLSTASRLSPFSPEFQSMTLEKGALIFHMLRWTLGEDAFLPALRGALSQYTDKSVRSGDFEHALEAASQQQLTPFFAQWVDGTGAPNFNNKYAVYRLGNNKGFRTIGEVTQDLDLFRMPVELRIETDGKTVNQRIDVAGTSSEFVIDTFGRPRKISVDPDNWLLKSSPEIQVRIQILKGQQLAAQGDLLGALAEYQKALEANPNSSLASYRIGEILFTQHNYQASVNSYRDALRGDGEPRWTEVWSHIQIGKIFDITGQRDRAITEYRLAIQTNDNTQGGVNEARQYLSKPYQAPDSEK